LLTEEQIQLLLEGVDTDGDGQIDYIEFLNMMKNTIGIDVRMDADADQPENGEQQEQQQQQQQE